MKLNMNNLDKAKQDALNELTQDQSKLLIKQNTMQILNQIFSDNPDQIKLQSLSERQVTLTQFFYDKGFHFDMMHGIIDGCYETICKYYSELLYMKVMHDMSDLTKDVEHYVLMSDLIKDMKHDHDKKVIKKSMPNAKNIAERLKNLQTIYAGHEIYDVDDLNALINMFNKAQKQVKSNK